MNGRKALLLGMGVSGPVLNRTETYNNGLKPED
jgi:hypothetical protein